MEIKEALRNVRDEIKELSSLQVIGKRARKTTIPKEESKALLRKFGVETPAEAAVEVRCRKRRITALLNLHHELRGSEHRHGIEKGDEYSYEKTLKEIKTKLGLVVKA